MSGLDQNMEERRWQTGNHPVPHESDLNEMLHMRQRDGESIDQLEVRLLRASKIRVSMVDLTCGHSSNKPTPTMMERTHGLVRLHWCAWCNLARMASVGGEPPSRKVGDENPLAFIDKAFEELSRHDSSAFGYGAQP